MGFEPWMLAAMDDAGFNGITDEHIRRVAREIQEIGQAYIDRQTFNRACFAVALLSVLIRRILPKMIWMNWRKY